MSRKSQLCAALSSRQQNAKRLRDNVPLHTALQIDLSRVLGQITRELIYKHVHHHAKRILLLQNQLFKTTVSLDPTISKQKRNKLQISYTTTRTSFCWVKARFKKPRMSYATSASSVSCVIQRAKPPTAVRRDCKSPLNIALRNTIIKWS
jgi:hypothetical protein